MASSTTLLTTHFIKPFPSTSSLARFPSLRLSVAPLIKASASDCADSETPIPKGCPLRYPFQVRGRVLPHLMKERDDSILAKLDLPGISSKDLRVWVENHCITIKAEEEKDEDEAFSDDEEDDPKYKGLRKYSGYIPLPEGQYEEDEIEAKVSNGVLKLVIPKRTDIITIKVNN